MSAEQTGEPSLIDKLNGPMPRWLVYALVPGVLGPLLILGFIFVSELAHDPERCPYEPRGVQRLSNTITVREDARSCLPGVEERRFSVLREGAENVLGRRRFGSASFQPGQYRWRAALSARGEVSVTVDNDGHTQAVFREGTPEDNVR